jgi:tyrosine-specific transport protein
MMQTQNQKAISLSRLTSCTLMVAGTTIGAGMLGMPLITSKAGFFPAVGVTVAVWAFMLITGLLLLEACSKMPLGSNILTLSQHYLGTQGKRFVGLLFVFLYYCLLVAYFAAGSTLISSVFSVPAYMSLSGLFLVFGTIIALGSKSIDRVNAFLTIAMFLAYAFLIVLGSSSVEIKRLYQANLSVSLLATPILFSAFGYHNIIPSLNSYVGGDKRLVRLSIVWGTSLALVIFLLWQWMIIGSIPSNALERALQEGLPVTQALQEAAGRKEIYRIGQGFAFFALTTSLLGVCFSMVDFLAEAFKMVAEGAKRILLTLLTFIPPIACVLWNPTIFDKALGLAGGVGEAFLNGFVPIAFFALLKKDIFKNTGNLGLKVFLFLLTAFCLLVFAIEFKDLIH